MHLGCVLVDWIALDGMGSSMNEVCLVGGLLDKEIYG
jgi:hypothetical protein